MHRFSSGLNNDWMTSVTWCWFVFPHINLSVLCYCWLKNTIASLNIIHTPQVPKLQPFNYKQDKDMDGSHSKQSIEVETSLVQLPFQAARNNPDSQLE